MEKNCVCDSMMMMIKKLLVRKINDDEQKVVDCFAFVLSCCFFKACFARRLIFVCEIENNEEE